MNKLSYLSIILISTILLPFGMQAREFVGDQNAPKPTNNNTSSFRADCTEARSETELNINNVRARLRSGGDMWWDGQQARYIVPNVDPASGEPEISSLFSGAIWLGAYDGGDNLILAAQTYRSSGNDYWTGPLDPTTGTVEPIDCERWDKHFTVLGADIDALRADFLDPLSPGVDNVPSRGLLGWPGRGNPNFAAIHGFPIEQYNQDLAPFVDANNDLVYNPYDGDHPIIEVTGCPQNDYNQPVYADQMIWWVYNDNGNLHTQTNGLPMKMEVQVTSFGYSTTDAVNNMTFYRYKLLNRNALQLKETYFALWSDPDLGCANDDYIGCDTTTGMGYVYNEDANDDNPCGTQGSPGYGTDIPALGVDYFKGPLDSAGNQIGLSSFQYHENNNTPLGDPSSAIGYYRLMSGFWPNETPITAGGTGYDPGNTSGTPTNFVFPSFPNETGANAWSMCSENLATGDRRFIHTSGPFVLEPGRTNEMISGVVWVPSIPDYPCPSLKPLVAADVFAQNLFDDCFKITDGPDAPFMDVVELNQELVLNLSYTPGQNNFGLKYEESPSELTTAAIQFPGVDTTYNFQGYLVYQVNDPNLSVTDLEDESKARLIYQTDVEDGVAKIANWEKVTDEDLGIDVNVPTIKVEGGDEGIRHTFPVTEDQFAEGNKDLINHKPYYFCVVAYAHNEFRKFDPVANEGQAIPYLQGRKNFRIYTAIPRINDPEYNGLVINSTYGDRPGITRYEGSGNGVSAFLEIVNRADVETNVLAGNNVEEIVYAPGGAPINVKVVDPLRVAGGTYRLYIGDNDYTWRIDSVAGGVTYTPQPSTVGGGLKDSLYWVIADVNDPSMIWSSFQTMDVNYEQYIPDLGISIMAQQASKPGAGSRSGNVGSRITYQTTAGADTAKWYAGVLDGESVYNMLKTGAGEEDERFDPEQSFSDNEGGWYPFMLGDAVARSTGYYLSHGNIGTTGANTFRNPGASVAGNVRDTLLYSLNNVNIVMTPDQSKWSRCMVVETANRYHGTAGLGLSIPSERKQGEWKGDITVAPPFPTIPKKTYYSRNKDMSIDSSDRGMSWFPGYAYDVETGQRVNIFFGENSIYDGSVLPENLNPGSSTGDDMIFNPTSTNLTGPFSSDEDVAFLRSVLGGQHIIYVTRQPYDSCKALIEYQTTVPATLSTFDHDHSLYPSMDITWSSFALLSEGMSFGGQFGEMPPSEATVELRVRRPHDKNMGTAENEGYPLYEFSLDGLNPTKEEGEVASSALDLMRVVPNPYYAYSDYEVTEVDNVVKITNVPAKCNIRIYGLDGRFIREYNIAQEYPDMARNGITRLGQFGSNELEEQILTSVEWDLKNQAAVPVSSGVYLIHVMVPGVGERVLKSFIINRAFDAQRL